MRGPGWTPSIVPDDNDQTVYLVAADLGNPAELGRRPNTKGPTWRPLFKTCLQANTAIRSG